MVWSIALRGKDDLVRFKELIIFLSRMIWIFDPMGGGGVTPDKKGEVSAFGCEKG